MPLPQPGENVSGQLDLLGKHIPLPTGEWRVASAGFGHVTGAAPGPYGAIGAVLLLQTGEQEERPFLLIQTNVLAVRDGWGPPDDCSAPDMLLADVAEARNLHNACSFIVATRPSRMVRAALPALGSDVSVMTLLPPWALVLGFRVSDRRDVLDVRYGIVPRKPRPDGWFFSHDKLDLPHRTVVDRLGEWTLHARSIALEALRDPAQQVPSLPPLPLGDVAALEPPPPEISALRLALYKLASYRVASTFTALTSGAILTGSLYGGAVFAFWQAMTHSVIYLANELIWEWPQLGPNMRFVATPHAEPPAESVPAAAIPPDTMIAASSPNLPPLPRVATLIPSAPSHIRNVFAVDGKQVPLPEGSWTILAQGDDNLATGTVLGRMDNGNLIGLVVIHTNPNPMAGIFGASSQCNRTDIAFAVTRYDTPEDGYCTYAKQVSPDLGADITTLTGKAFAKLRADGVRLPTVLAAVGARARTRKNFLDVRYYFLPDPALTHRDRQDTGLTPDPTAVLQSWADLAQEPIELGVRGRLPAISQSLPWPWQVNAVNNALIWQARAPLQDLAAMGALDDTALRQQLTLADRALNEREQQRWSVWQRSAYKVATYRIASFVDTVAVATLATGSPGAGIGYAGFTAVFKPMVAYANEILWAQAGIGKAPASLLPANFSDIGPDIPK